MSRMLGSEARARSILKPVKPSQSKRAEPHQHTLSAHKSPRFCLSHRNMRVVIFFLIVCLILDVGADSEAEAKRLAKEIADSTRSNAINSWKSAQQQAKDLKKQATSQAKQAIQDAKSKAQKIQDDAKKEADALLNRARSEIEKERDDAIGEVRREFADLTVKAAGKVIEKSLDKEEHRELIDKVLEESSTKKKE